jgi:hypothetical protein
MLPRWRWTLAIILTLLASRAPAQGQEIILTPGLANLEFRFSNSSPEVIDYLTAHPVWADSRLAVRMFNPGEDQPAAETTYIPGSLPSAASATAVARPAVAPAGSTFLVELDHLILGPGITYRFGTASPVAAAARPCGPVFPRETHPAGTTCQLSECAALVRLRVSLEDQIPDPAAHADLDGLDESIPIFCSATVHVEEVAYSGRFVPQATANNLTFELAVLSGEGGVLPVLVRADGSRVALYVSCLARVKDGENGFVLIPDSTRNTPLAPAAATFLTPACDAVMAVEIPIEVERTAGVLKGLFDVNGRTEILTEVTLRRGWSGVQPPVVPAGSIPSPSDAWIFEGAPATTPTTRHDLGAQALVDDGRHYVELPHRRGLNDGVDVARGSVTDLGSTFVTRPHTLSGRVVLDDRGVGIGLDQINTAAFASLTPATDPPYSRSSIGAAGLAELAVAGKSGDGGLSLSVLEGGYDATAGKARFVYELLLTGLSDPGDALDGSGSAPTPWLVKELNLIFGDFESRPWESLRTTIGVLLPRTTRAIPASGVPLPLEPLPELHMCLGEISITMKTNAAQARLHDPRIWAIAWPPGAAILTIPGDPHALYELRGAEARGTPAQIEARADTVEVSLRLPAGTKYSVEPSVNLSSPDGQDSTRVRLGFLELPAGGPLQCGEITRVCSRSSSSGGSSLLSLAVAPPVPACHDTGSVAFEVVFDSDLPVRWLKLQVDDQDPQVLCSPCTLPDGSTPAVPVNLTVPADDRVHTLRLFAEDDAACPAEVIESVLVPSQPLALICPQDFSCSVPVAELPLSPAHPCVTNGLTAPQIVGGCQYPTQIFDDRPATFPLGATEVTFTASPGEAICKTTVTVARLPERQLAYAEGNELKVRELGSGLFQMVETAPAPVLWIEFDAAGERLGAALQSAQTTAIVYDVETGSEHYRIQTHPIGANLQFNPGNPEQVALVTRSPADPLRYWVELFRNEQSIGAFALPPEESPSLPEIAWNAAGDRLLALYAVPELAPGVPSPDRFHVRILDWNVAASNLGNPVSWSRRRDGTREEPFEAIYLAWPGTAVFCSGHGVSKAGGVSLPLISGVPNDHMDLTADGGRAAFVKLTDLGHTKLAVLEAPGSGVTPLLHQGPTLPMRSHFKPRVAISDDGSRIAVSLGERIDVFAYPGFHLLESFSAENVQHMRFRPRGQDGEP